LFCYSHLFCYSITFVLLLTHICSVTQSHLFCYSLTFVLLLTHICSVTHSHLFCYSITFVLCCHSFCMERFFETSCDVFALWSVNLHVRRHVLRNWILLDGISFMSTFSYFLLCLSKLWCFMLFRLIGTYLLSCLSYFYLKSSYMTYCNALWRHACKTTD
jgi:hypothetical protein